MRQKVKEYIDQPEQLEKLYQADKKNFKNIFYEILPEIKSFQGIEFWKARLEFDDQKVSSVRIQKADILVLLISCFIAGFLIKLPQIFNIDLKQFFFYEKNAPIIVFLGLSSYLFLSRGHFNFRHILLAGFAFLISAVYINFLPTDNNSDSIILAFIHLPLTLWCIYGLIYIDFNINDKFRRIDFIKFNGDLAILGAVIIAAGVAMTGITIGLFAAIDLQIEKFYIENIGIIGLVSAPIVATFIIKKYPFVTNKIAPIIANIFSPLALITLLVYLISIAFSGKDPYNDRNFLIVFNGMLLGVMAITVFSVSETSLNTKQRFNEMTLFALSIVTLIIDLIAISAIIYRLGEFGFTPNRIAVLGSNILIFGNLIIIMIDLYQINFKKKDIKRVELSIAKYLPLYALWTIFMVFILPLIFGFK